MRKPNFSVVTFVVAMLVVFGIAGHYLQNVIGKVPANQMANASEGFLNQAGEQPIDWQRLDASVFAKARNRNAPILLVAGSGDSLLARYVDEHVLTNPDVASRLRRAFICARVDTDASPIWLNAFRPLSRAGLDYLADVSIVVLDAKGNFVGSFLPPKPNADVDFKSFLQFLSQSERDALQSVNSEAAQAEEIQTLETSQEFGLPDFGGQLTRLIQFDNPNGGFPIASHQNPMPLAWRFLLTEGRIDAFRSSLDPVLLSPDVNWLDGGFFRSASSADWNTINFDESSELDAEMMWTLAIADAMLGVPFYRSLSQQTFDRLIDDFGSDGWIAAYQKGDELTTQRSTRYSFSPRRLRDLFPDSNDRDWVQENLQMRVGDNPLMVPQLKDRNVWAVQSERLNRTLDVLRKANPDTRTFGGLDILEVNGLVAARLIQCARLWNDPARMAKASELAIKLDIFVNGDDVSRTTGTGSQVAGCLPDYLAYADSCLQTYLATGRTDRFRAGLHVLRRAIFLFASGKAGIYRMAPSDPTISDAENPPEILDHYRESASAWLARLTLAYGQMLGPSGQDLTKVAEAIVAKFSNLAGGLGPYSSGYFEAAARVVRSEVAFCVGPQSLVLAQQLFERSPTRLVVIAGGDVRPDLDSKKPGIYLVRGEDMRGPLTLEQAAKEFPASFPYDSP